ncbi:TPA: hypothetical protein ACH3X2_007561 [Trebouxia sp. C0005]
MRSQQLLPAISHSLPGHQSCSFEANGLSFGSYPDELRNRLNVVRLHSLLSHMQRGLEVVEGKGAAEEQLQHDLSRTLALQQLLTLNDISQEVLPKMSVFAIHSNQGERPLCLSCPSSRCSERTDGASSFAKPMQHQEQQQGDVQASAAASERAPARPSSRRPR